MRRTISSVLSDICVAKTKQKCKLVEKLYSTIAIIKIAVGIA